MLPPTLNFAVLMTPPASLASDVLHTIARSAM